MAYEIERKFLVRDESWREKAGKPALILQAYLARTGTITLRVRIKDSIRATLTAKSAAAELRRMEFEYAIPLADATALLCFREGAVVEKLRYRLPQRRLTWEVDVFRGENEGLVIAEIELPHEGTVFDRPPWLGREITSDRKYSNASLAMKPFQTWSDAPKT
ncbi:MAG: CYTH domain-containing protein [Rhodomicrobium sp.]